MSSSMSTEFGPTTTSGNQIVTVASPPSRQNNGRTMSTCSRSVPDIRWLFLFAVNLTPSASRSNHLYVNGKGKCEHPSKKSSVDPSIFARYAARPMRSSRRCRRRKSTFYHFQYEFATQHRSAIARCLFLVAPKLVRIGHRQSTAIG